MPPDTPSTLPSTYRRPSADAYGWGEPTFFGTKEPQGSLPGMRNISATTLAYASQCRLRGLWQSIGYSKIGPSPFTQASLQDGLAYEKALLKQSNRGLWIRAINQALGLSLPHNLKLLHAEAPHPNPDESPSNFIQRAAEALNKNLGPVGKLPQEPFAVSQALLARKQSAALLRGMPDLLIWTGQQWVITDIKCSEEARRTHGIQIAAYHRLLQQLRPGEAIHPMGVVVHCAAGYRFTKSSTQKDREVALKHTLATPFPIASLERATKELLAFLTRKDFAVAEQEAIAEANFTSTCNECEFRLTCYPRFLQAKHISLLPIMTAELEAMKDAGIKTIENLLSALEDRSQQSHQTLRELKENSPLQLRFLQQKAQKVLSCGLYSSWQANPDTTTKPLFFVAAGSKGLFSSKPNPKQPPSCLVVYTEDERRLAWALLLQNYNVQWKPGLPTFILSEEIQQTLHGPIPSLTLRPLAAFLGWHQGQKTLEELQEWLKSNYSTDLQNLEQSLQDSTEVNQRLNDLQTVWNFLQNSALKFEIPTHSHTE